MHVDPYNPDTFLWILEECDVPYVPKAWNEVLAKYADDPKVSGTTVVGRYLAKMKLNQYKKYRWCHNDVIQEIADKEVREVMARQGYSDEDITTAIAQTNLGILARPAHQIETPDTNPFLATGEEDYFAELTNAEDDFNEDLTEAERTYLRLKWGKTYKPEEWIKLEQLYEEMMASYDIQGAGHIDTLKLICKTSLKANQLIDIGDIEGFQKMSKVYDSLMKSGKFTAAQNKGENGDFVDSVGELIELCEKQGYIERFYVESPNDKVDLTIQDMQRYTRTLIEEETNLSNMVEQALKQIQKEDEDAENNQETDIVDDDNIDLEDIEKSLKDEDFNDFNDFLEEESEQDLEEIVKRMDL